MKSKNAATVRLGMQTGIDNVIALSKRAGLARVMGKDEKGSEVLNLRRFPATYLGSSEMTLMDVTLAYTIFPDAGSRPAEPYIIQRIVDKNGAMIFESHPEKRFVIKDTTAYEVHSCLSDVLDQGTGYKAFTTYGSEEVPPGGQNRHGLQLHRRLVHRLLQQHHLRRLGRVRQAGPDLSRRLFQRCRPARMGGCHEQLVPEASRHGNPPAAPACRNTKFAPLRGNWPPIAASSW